ncbi:MAG TPA: peptide synthetase [Chloroflexi bacterium]|nr:peptide synthetase [Chloroflexota bacterium]
MELLKIQIVKEIVYSEGFRVLDKELNRVTCGAVIKNPYVNRFSDDLEDLVSIGEELGELLGMRAVDELEGDPHSYGKAVIVGMNGELEHAAALMHPKLGGPLRKAVGGGMAIIPSAKKKGGPGTSIDVPLHYKDAMKVRSHFDAVEFRIADAPNNDEIVIVISVTNGGRPHPRVGGLEIEDIVGNDGIS